MSVSEHDKQVAAEEVLQHWGRLFACTTIKEVEDEGFGVESCAFCQLYQAEEEIGDVDEICGDCPVALDTGMDVCLSTPYIKAYGAIYGCMVHRGTFEEMKVHEYIGKERDYLTNLIRGGDK